MKLLLLIALCAVAGAVVPPRRLFTCVDSSCVQTSGNSSIAADSKALPLQACLISCGRLSLWPLPKQSTVGGTLSSFSRCTVSFTFGSSTDPSVKDLLSAAGNHFVVALANDKLAARSTCEGAAHAGALTVNFEVNSSESTLRASSDESYTLNVGEGTSVTVQAAHFAGAMQALQTLTQLTAYNPLTGAHVVAHAEVIDSPAFQHRGILVDTSRHFLPIEQLQKTVRAMAQNKLNVLHMHISDTASFPIELSTGLAQKVTEFGAYGPDQYYTTHQIAALVQYAKEHAVRVVPEIDAPAHANEGWQWGESEGLGELSVCRGMWTNKGLEPPSGQLNVANPAVYEVLDLVYNDIVGLFQSDVYHLGGDEVIVGSDTTFAACWNSTEYGRPILEYLEQQNLDRGDPQVFYSLWANFTTRAAAGLKKAYSKAAPNQPLSKMMQWGGGQSAPSDVTYNLVAQPYVEKVLPPEEFIIQVWDNVEGSITPDLLKRGYEVVLSNTDYTYLDCGEPGWVKPGGYWCNPFHEWFKVYDYVNDVRAAWNLTSTDGITGGEVALWGEEVDENNFDPKMWPRGAALGEALWSDPSTGYSEAQDRMHHHRERMVNQGVHAAAMQTQWCLYNGGCDVKGGTPQRR